LYLTQKLGAFSAGVLWARFVPKLATDDVHEIFCIERKAIAS
jgi:hypothetical protein